MAKGGGSSQTTTVDPVYNAGLLALSQEQQGWAAEMFNQFKYGTTYDPNEQVKGAYVDGKWVNEADLPKSTPASTLSPYRQRFNEDGSRKNPGEAETSPSSQYNIETRTRGEIEGYNPNAQTSEMDYLQNLVNSNQSLLGLQTDVSKKQLGLEGETIGAQRELLPLQTGLARETIGAQRELLPLQTGVQKQRLGLATTFLGDINKGIDVNSRMDEAQAGVQHGFKQARKANDMNTFSYGLDPSSGRYASSNRELTLAEAGGIAGARTEAKNLAEQQDFDRKKTGLTIQY